MGGWHCHWGESGLWQWINPCFQTQLCVFRAAGCEQRGLEEVTAKAAAQTPGCSSLSCSSRDPSSGWMDGAQGMVPHRDRAPVPAEISSSLLNV